MKDKVKVIALLTSIVFCNANISAQCIIPNGDFEDWTLYPEGISGGGDFYMPVSADGTEEGLYNAVGNSWWHENMQNIAGRFYNSEGYFYRYEEDDANGYALKLKGSGPSANGFIRFRCDEVPISLKGRYKFSNTGCDDFAIYAYAINDADTLPLSQLYEGIVHSSAKSFVAPITESFQNFEIDLSDFKDVDIDCFVIMFSAHLNGSCTKTLPGIGDLFTNDPNGFAVVDDLELKFQTLTSVNELSKELDVIVFPNPTSSLVTVKLGKFETSSNMQLFDMVGNILIEKIAESDMEQLDLNSFSPGIYFLYIRQDLKEMKIKIIKQ